MCLKTFCEASPPSGTDPFASAYEIWSRLSKAWDAAYYAQEAANKWDESVTDELASVAETAFDRALKTAPETFAGMELYISMLTEHGVANNPDAIEIALVTLGRSIETLKINVLKPAD